MAAKFVISYDERGDGWFASIYTVPGCHAEAPTFEEARVRIVSALALFFDGVSDDEVVDGEIHSRP